MSRLSKIILLLFLIPTVSAQPVSIEYFHQAGCYNCEITDPIIKQIEEQYDDIMIQWIDTSTPDGFSQWRTYGFLEVPAIVINNETKIPKDEITEDNLRSVIAVYLTDGKPDNDFLSTEWSIPLAYSLGLFSGFSPCLMAVLGFILSFTAGTSSSVQNGMVRALVFGLGLVTAYVILGACTLFYRRSLPDIEGFSIAIGVITILIGLNLTGILKSPFTVDTFFQQSAKKYAGTMAGIFFLGFLFSVVKVPCAAPLLLVLLNNTFVTGTINDLLLLLAFGGGVLTPFIGIGIIGGCTLSERVRSYRVYIRLISGVVLILFGIWELTEI
ncbi:MAG: sulfite exporter TauE/SafE family protein [Methanosarcinaceae archaeon]|nr:sulfite exporter TauE/SafE family protein [Methanosarcinaceae archaeon]